MYGLKRLRLLVLLILFLQPVQAMSRYYRPEDWVSYTDFRYIHSLASDLRFVYLATTGGIARFNRLTNSWDEPLTVGDGLPGTPVRIVAPDPSTRNLWVATRSRISRYNPTSESWKSFSELKGVSASQVAEIGIGGEYIYARAGDGTYRLNRVVEVWESSPEPPSGVRWYGGEQDLRKYPFLAPYYVLDSRLGIYDMTCVSEDGFDLWVGTSGYGLFHYNSLTFAREHQLFGLAGDGVRALEKVDEVLWIGGGSDGVTLWNLRDGSWTHFEPETNYGFLSSKVREIASDSLWVWLATDEGVSRYTRVKGEWKTYTIFDGLWTNSATSLEVDGDTLWIGTEEGLCRMAKGSEKIRRISDFRYMEINDIVSTPSHLWLATSDGVFYLDKKRGGWRRLESPDQRLGVGTNSVLLDGGRIWFGTRLGGVVCYDLDEGDWENYLAPTHLPSNRVVSLGADGENLWVGTPMGVTRFNRKWGSWTTYTTSDGLISERVEEILPDGDWVYFGTRKGLTKFWWNDPFLPK